ncbi:MAG: ABC transporter permease, partial [Rhodospirillaceae bacterium]
VLPDHRILLDRLDAIGTEHPPEPARYGALSSLAEATGRATAGAVTEAVDLLHFLGLATTTAARSLVRPARIRGIALASHIETAGLRAMPIVGLLAFLIGVVIAYQGADQLRQFGAEIFTVNLLAVSMLREMGILMTAIIIAGRSGSAFTAQIGTMQVNEEVDAMRTIGLDPIEVLVLPRAFALLIVLPLLTVYANLMGLAGGALMSLWVLDISLVQFIERLRSAVPIWAFWVGVIKAPVFGFVIALVGCHEGLKVRGSAESVGRQTTRSVVVSIFLVMVLDAIFSIFFSAAGV